MKPPKKTDVVIYKQIPESLFHKISLVKQCPFDFIMVIATSFKRFRCVMSFTHSNHTNKV